MSARPGRQRLALLAAGGSLLLAAGCEDPSRTPPPVPEGAIPAGTSIGSGGVHGRVTFTGEAPEQERIDMASDASCARDHGGAATRETLVVNEEGELKNAFVHVSSGLGDRVFAPPAGHVTLDQRGCVYRPHVVGVQVGQPLEIINSDPTLHNVHAEAEKNKGFNFGMSVQGQKAIRYFHQPEVMVRIKCDVHPWMATLVGVSPHPFFAVTDEEGAFRIEGLPAGEYTIEVWHETLGPRSATVTLGEAESREIDFRYEGS